jgi:HipA-like protein
VTVRRIAATRYVTPLREGGSLPAIVEGDDDGLYVLKFRGAGQGLKALVAELIAGELARAVGLAVPEIVLMDLDAGLARAEPDPEIQALIQASVGLNLALDYLPGSVTFDPVAERPDAALASSIVWFDALVANIDRSARNTNMLLWHRKLWLIDHGAALYVHHAGGDFAARAKEPFAQIKDHVLLPAAGALVEADARMAPLLTREVIAGIVALVPESWLDGERRVYTDYLARRLEAPRVFLEDAIRARSHHV